MSTTALEIDTPQLCATQLVARPGSLPTITFPMIGEVVPDAAGIWTHLSEPAEFFAVPMPDLDELTAAIGDFASRSGADAGSDALAITVTIADADGAHQILVSGSVITPVRRDAVRIVSDGAVTLTHHATDPEWRRMAARTTSKGDVDQLQRWLNGRGFADAVVGDVPVLGALVVQAGSDVVGIENPEPTSILDQMTRCGAVSTIGRTDTRPPVAERIWWISSHFEVHPVAEVDGIPFSVDAEVDPPFARWS